MKKTTRLLVLFLVLLLATGAWMLAQKSGDRPPGIPAEKWIPLTENSGIVLRDTSRTFNVRGQHGTLFVNVGNGWQEVYLDSGPAGFLPLSR